MTDLHTPTNHMLDQYISKFQGDERYFPADQAITKLFKAFPENKNIEDVLLKISVINDLYSTNILGTFKMANHIQKLDIDRSLKQGDPGVVHRIATGHNIRTKKHNTEINFYSFATKYCNWHNEEAYAIYDSFVQKTLMAYKRRDSFSAFTQKDLKDFRKFKMIIEDFASFYGLSKHSPKEIDNFLWIYGKEKFPADYQ